MAYFVGIVSPLIGTRLFCAWNTPLHHFYDLPFTMLYDSPMISFLHDPFHHLHSLYFHPYSTDVCHRQPTPTTDTDTDTDTAQPQSESVISYQCLSIGSSLDDIIAIPSPHGPFDPFLTQYRLSTALILIHLCINTIG